MNYRDYMYNTTAGLLALCPVCSKFTLYTIMLLKRQPKDSSIRVEFFYLGSSKIEMQNVSQYVHSFFSCLAYTNHNY